MAAPFLCAIVLSFFVPASALGALAFFILFFLILGIKDLILVDRGTAYEALIFLLIFLAAVLTYAAAGPWDSFGNWATLFGVGAMAVLLLRKLPWQDPPHERRPLAPVLVFGFLMFELALVLLFLSLDFLYQASILFLFGVFASYALVRLRLRQEGARPFQPFLYYFFAFALAAGFILTLNSWRI